MKKPNFFIVGAPRCATTSLWSFLKGHPEIYMATPKELYFFDSDLWGKAEWAPSLEQYLGYFSAARDQTKIGEATPSYLRSQRAPKEIKAFSPTAQIIIMLRNPVEVMYSLHAQGLRFGIEPIADFEAALEADAGRSNRERQGYREFTDFPAQVQRYFEVFGRESVHTIVYDDLKANPAAVCESTLRFLGVCTNFTMEFPVVNAKQQIRSAHLQRILWRPSPALRGIGRTLVPRWLRPQVRRALLDTNLVAAKPRPPMDTKLKRQLQKEFEPQVEELTRLIGRDLSGWCKELRGEGE